MKKIIFLLSLTSLVFPAAAQKTAIPAQVQKAFQEQYQEATEVEWEMENTNEFEVEFELAEMEYTAEYDEKGNWIETSREIKSSKLPEIVRNQISNLYPGFKIDEAEEIEMPDFKGYEVELEKGKKEVVLLIGADGTIYKTEPFGEDKDHDED